jgi:predicted Zn-dependent protease
MAFLLRLRDLFCARRTPYGDSAYDLFQKGGLSESDLADLRQEVEPLLQSRGNEVVRQLVSDGYNPSANELNDTAKLYNWLNQLTPGNTHQAREHYFQGRAAYERQDWNSAENEFRQVMRLEPSWALPVNTLAQVYLRRRDFNTALNCYDEAIRLEPNWIFPRINKCVLVNENLRNFVQGEQACRDVLQLDSNKASAYYYLGRALEGQNNRCGACEQYRLALEKAAGNNNPGFNVNRLNTIVSQCARQCGGA